MRAWVRGEKMNPQFESWLEHAASGAQEAQDGVRVPGKGSKVPGRTCLYPRCLLAVTNGRLA